jgi:uncharacterized protein (UPF0335 family)
MTEGNGQLRALVERIENLEAEKAAISEDVKSVYAEAKGSGWDTKVLRRIVNIRKDRQSYEEQEAVLALYLADLGMIQRDAA